MQNNVFIANTVYQVMVAMWMKSTLFQDTISDIIISDHMNGGKGICERLKQKGIFSNCIYVESHDFCYGKIKESKWYARFSKFSPNIQLNNYFGIKKLKSYDAIIVANLDRFYKLLFDAVERKSPNVMVYWYEDGLATYSKLSVEYLRQTKLKKEGIVRIVYKYLYRKKSSYDYIRKMFLFNPNLLDWNPHFSVVELPKIPINDNNFRELCNDVFSYDGLDVYDKKYLFMEESYFADEVALNDVELLEKISKNVGKNNIMVKIHPRNPVNRFEKLGYKTNQNTSIPWEVVLMNLGDISDKILITIASASVLNPILVFGQRVKVFSLINLVEKEKIEKTALSGELGKFFLSLFDRLKSNDICICKNIDDIE